MHKSACTANKTPRCSSLARDRTACCFCNQTKASFLRCNIQRGYTYVRQLASTSNAADVAGEMRFVISSESIFNLAKQYNLPNLAIMDNDENIYIIAQDGKVSVADYARIVADGYGQGQIQTFAGSVRYAVHTSSQHGYRFIMAYDTNGLIAQNSNMVLFTVAGTVLVFGVIMLMLMLNMRHDADFLAQIIGTIDKAKTATFSPIASQYKGRGEYGMIAESLNDMSLKLDEHIRTEYLLKLRQQETEMIALQHQIDPHFLYNTLEIIRSAALVNQDMQVADAITNLGHIYLGGGKVQDEQRLSGADVFARNEAEIFGIFDDLPDAKGTGDDSK